MTREDLFKMTPEVTDLWTCDITIYRTGIPIHYLCKKKLMKEICQQETLHGFRRP